MCFQGGPLSFSEGSEFTTVIMTYRDPKGPEFPPRSFATLPVSPHVLLFIVYNALYFFPLLFVFLLGYEQGGIEEILAISGATMRRICFAYGSGIAAFVVGAYTPAFLSWSLKGRSRPVSQTRWLQIGVTEKIAIVIVCIIFVASKASLVPLGVYRDYAFDTDSMIGGRWTFSMFCSEAMVLAGIVLLFSKSKKRLRNFFIISALNGLNLLHGTRIFFISTVMVLVMYGYVRGKVTLKRAMLYGPLVFAFVLGLTYITFLSRSHVSTTGAFSAVAVVSPVVYESVLSQMSLIGVLGPTPVGDTLGHPLRFVMDIFLFTVPRFLLPDKESFIYIERFYYLSPFGAFNGYAQGIIYFGVLFPVFYFLLGLTGSYLYRKSGQNPWWFLLYIFFTADFLLHIMRDGYLVPFKMLINTAEFIFILILLRSVARVWVFRPRALGVPKPT
jgi:oligosaccharide repeat unit polymerase